MQTRGLIDRVAVIGSGSIGRRHMGTLSTILPSACIKLFSYRLICEVDEGVFVSEIGRSHLESFAPQIAIVASPAVSHIALTLELIKMGCHVLVEKPLSNDSRDLESLLSLEEVSSCKVQVGYNLRFDPSLQYFKSLTDSGIVGRINSVRCDTGQYLPDWRPDKAYQSSVSAQKSLGGGVLNELSHEIDYLIWMFGMPASVRGLLIYNSTLDTDVEDIAFINMIHEQAEYSSTFPVSVSLDFTRHDAVRQCSIIGDAGTLRWNGILGQVSICHPGSSEWQILFRSDEDRNLTYAHQFRSFIAAIVEGDAVSVSLRQGYRVMQVIDLIRESSKAQHNTITVEGLI